MDPFKWAIDHLFRPKPLVVFSRSKAAAAELVKADETTTDRLVAELTKAGKPVPAYFAAQANRSRSSLLKSVRG